MYYKKLLAYSINITKDRQRSEETVHEVFTRLWKQDYDKLSGHMSAWLFTVCRNCSLKTLKKNKRYVEAFEDESLVEDRDPSEELEHNEKKRLMLELMKMLSDKQKSVLICRFYQDLNYEQTGKKVGATVGNVGFLQNRALNKLRILMEKELSK